MTVPVSPTVPVPDIQQPICWYDQKRKQWMCDPIWYRFFRSPLFAAVSVGGQVGQGKSAPANPPSPVATISQLSTQAAFALSSDGEDGADGFVIPGPQGTQGAAGAAIPGQDGIDGEDGWTIPGPPGPAGSAGTQIIMFTDLDPFDEPMPWPPGATDGGSQTVATLTNTGARTDRSYSYQQPATGFSITIGNSVYTLILDPAGILATGTITMPAAPLDGQLVRMTSTQSITSLTVAANAGQSITNAPTAFTVNLTGDQGYEFIYRAANTTWYRLQ
jgi:hypothetical protein